MVEIQTLADVSAKLQTPTSELKQFNEEYLQFYKNLHAYTDALQGGLSQLINELTLE
ncbi:hypothetical protein HY947_05750 [Candidatus Gottesmanbacteria bacterium]|nr:hypothetical protein [Candidatus Gottesmanbacteria bacterium]